MDNRKEIIEYCRQITGSESKVNYGALPYRENEMMDLRCSVNKLETIIGERIRFKTFDRVKELI